MSVTLPIVDPPYPNGVPWWGNTSGTYTQTSPTLWSGPICQVCGNGYLIRCQRNHKPYVDTGYVGRRRLEWELDVDTP